MMPAAKHGDPQLGVDIHMCAVPPSPSPVPLPTPHMSIVFDPFDYVPIFGATVTVCGMKRATAGTNAMVVHIPPGFPIVPTPKPPEKDDELFMGSSTVVADGDPFSFIAVPVLSCQIAGMPSIPRLKKKGPKKLMLLPLTVNLAIPTNVVVGGPPTISLMGMAFKGLFAALGKFAKSGLFKRIRQRLFKNLNPGFLKCTILRAEPVNILTGTVSVEQGDFTLPGRIPIEWVRSYSSGSQHSGLCGHGWETPADTRLEVDASNGSVSLIHPTVSPLFFNRLPIAEGEGSSELELMDGTLLSDHGDEFRIRTKEDRIYHFDKALAQVNGEGVTEYPIIRITDLCGNWLEFERRGKRIISIKESAGRRIEIASENSRITEIALYLPDTQTRHVFVRYEYDMAGDLISVIDALGKPYTFAYDAHHMVRHTDRNGLTFYYEYDKSPDGDRRVVHAWGEGDLYNYRFQYFDELNERRITDSLGHVSIVKLDEQGFPISEIDPLGGMTIYEYDAAGRTIGVTDPDGHRTGYEYDERGNLLKVLRPDKTATLTEYDQSSRPCKLVDAKGNVWLQEWDDRGLMCKTVSPRGDETNYVYDQHGDLTRVVDPLGHATTIVNDRYGNLVCIQNALGHEMRFEVDALGSVIASIDPAGGRTINRYDAKSRMVEQSQPSGRKTAYEYDREDNLTRFRDDTGNVTEFSYVGLGEVARRLQPDGTSVQYRYDTEERLIEVINERGESFRLRRDALGRVVEATDYWGQVQRHSYDAAGRLLQFEDALGRVTRYAYDSLGRLKEKRYFDGRWERFNYDPNGNLVKTENEQVTVERVFDEANRLIEEAQGEFKVVNVYDLNGNRIRRRSSHGNEVMYQYDAADNLKAIRINNKPVVEIRRDARGLVVGERLSSSLERRFDYTADGLLTHQQLVCEGRSLVDRRYEYEPKGNLAKRLDAAKGVTLFSYDPIGRIVEHIDPERKVRRFLHDPAGDLLQPVPETDDPSAGRSAEYDGTTYRFDAAGNLVERSGKRGRLVFDWDGKNRLVGAKRDDGTSTVMGYDSQGRRFYKETNGVRITFAWDGIRLLSEQTGDGSPREYVYYPESFEPLAVIGDDSRVNYFQNDGIGLPHEVCDASGMIVWSAAYGASGAVEKLYVDEQENPLRLQGQYYDKEIDLCYNLHRYYDLGLGCFVSQDPVGLAGGLNIYAYAPNVWTWLDPLGLACEEVERGLEAMQEALGHYSAAPAHALRSIRSQGAHIRHWSGVRKELEKLRRRELRENAPDMDAIREIDNMLNQVNAILAG